MLLLEQPSRHDILDIFECDHAINLNSDYWSAYTNQIYFCKPFTDMGYNIVDTLDEYSSPYNNANAKDLVIYGKGKPPLLSPIGMPHV